MNLFLSSCQSRSMATFSNYLISISSNPSSIHLNLFLSLRQSKCKSIFFNLPFSISFYSIHLFTSIFFYIFANLNSRLSSSISPFLCNNYDFFVLLLRGESRETARKLGYFWGFFWGP